LFLHICARNETSLSLELSLVPSVGLILDDKQDISFLEGKLIDSVSWAVVHSLERGAGRRVIGHGARRLLDHGTRQTGSCVDFQHTLYFQQSILVGVNSAVFHELDGQSLSVLEVDHDTVGIFELNLQRSTGLFALCIQQ